MITLANVRIDFNNILTLFLAFALALSRSSSFFLNFICGKGHNKTHISSIHQNNQPKSKSIKQK